MEATQERTIGGTIPQRHSTALGTTSMVLGIIGTLIFLAPYFGLPLSITAVVMASIQRTRDRRAGEVVLGRTTTGTIMGIIGIVVNGVTSLIVLVALAIFRHTS